jgi:nicotinamide mononucleotide adenylyltransferase
MVEQLTFGYHQMCVVQEEKLNSQEQQLRQAHSQMLVDVQSEVFQRERDIILALQSAQDIVVSQELESVEQRRCAALQCQFDEMSNVQSWLQRKQDDIDECIRVDAIYRDELNTANQLADVLKAENRVWEAKKEEIALSTRSVIHRPGVKALNIANPFENVASASVEDTDQVANATRPEQDIDLQCKTLADDAEQHRALLAKIAARRQERSLVQSEMDQQRKETESLAKLLEETISFANHRHIVLQLSQEYQQMRVIHEQRLIAEEQEANQAAGVRLAQLESEVSDRARDVILVRKQKRDLEVVHQLESVEKRRCEMLQQQLDEQSQVWPWLRRRQEELDEHSQLAAIYRDELNSATELADVLKAENRTLEHRLSSESAVEQTSSIALYANLLPEPVKTREASLKQLPMDVLLSTSFLSPVTKQALSGCLKPRS